MSVLITGSQGFIGERLCAHLSKISIPYVELQGDVRNAKTYPTEQIETVIHLASLIPQKGSWTLEDLYAVNVEGTRRLFDYYSDAKFLYVSTNDVTVQPLSEYAKTKLEAENIILQNNNNLVVRLPSIFGPNQKQDKLIPRLFKHYYRGETCEIYNNEEREYMFVDDAARQIWDSISKNEVVCLEGVRIRNKRLRELIKSVYMGNKPSRMTAQESVFFLQLVHYGKSFY